MLVVGLAALLAACAGPASPSPSGAASPSSPSGSVDPSPSTARPVLVDTDVAPDDVMALAYLAARPHVDLVAVTVSGTGEARCADGVRVVRAVLERLGQPGVPVACGRDTPLVGDHAFPAPWRDFVASGFGLDLPEPSGPASTIDAPDLIAQAASDADGRLEILTLGPLTNLAVALDADPSLAERLAGVTVMGGAVRTVGNVGDPDGDGTSVDAEWNAYIDPRALAIVVASGADLTLVPLDATDDVPMTPELVLRIAANRRTAAATLVYEYLARNPERLFGTSLWDQTSAILLADGSAGVTLERLPIRVLEGEEVAAGRTRVGPGGVESLVATEADPSVVTRRFIEGLNDGTAEVPIPAPSGTFEVAFDGPTCTVSGPTAIPKGFIELSFRNDADVDAVAAVVALEDGMSWATLVDLLEDGPLTAVPPGVRVVLQVDAAPASSEEGLAAVDADPHGIVCAFVDESGIRGVAGGPLLVRP
jgi:pyrimidine-specific ribonucleoside hydrolase